MMAGNSIRRRMRLPDGEFLQELPAKIDLAQHLTCLVEMVVIGGNGGNRWKWW